MREDTADHDKYENDTPSEDPTWATPDEDVDGELPVDVYHDNNAIYVKTMTAGVRKEDIEITLSREILTLRGQRYDNSGAGSDDYVYQELYWGTFSRTITLPEEVDIDRATAEESHGLLILTLPKLDRNRATQLRVE